MTKDEALRLALEALEMYELETNSEFQRKAITAIKAALEAKDEPVAWRTFDGEGGYDYRIYENNEDYANDWDKRNPKHKGWVEPLYTTPPQRTWVGLMRGVRVDGDTVVISVKGGNDEARELCGALLMEKNT